VSAAAGRGLVAIGGGTGLAVLLRGLKHHVGPGGLRHLAAVVRLAPVLHSGLR